MNRRIVLKSSVAAALADGILGWASNSEQHRIARIGVQLYTVREEIQRDFEGTLAKVAALGFREVEFAGFDKSPKVISGMLGRHGLSAPSAHVDSNAITKQLPQIPEAAHAIGHEYIVCSSIDETQRDADSLKRAVALSTVPARPARKPASNSLITITIMNFKPWSRWVARPSMISCSRRPIQNW